MADKYILMYICIFAKGGNLRGSLSADTVRQAFALPFVEKYPKILRFLSITDNYCCVLIRNCYYTKCDNILR